MEILRKICGFFIKPICYLIAKIVFRVKVIGIENVPKGKGCIICGNHIHALDAPALLTVTPRKIRFMAKQELWNSIGFRFMGFVFNVFPVKRGKNDTDAVKKSIKILKSNLIILFLKNNLSLLLSVHCQALCPYNCCLSAIQAASSFPEIRSRSRSPKP